METSELKKKLIQEIETLDDYSINRISKIMDDFKNEIVAHDTSGNPLILSKYNYMVQEGSEDLRQGRFYTQEEMEKEFLSWENE